MNPGVAGYEIYVYNIDFDVTANQVVNVFRGCGPIMRWYFPRKDPNKMNYGKHRGFGFIYFQNY
jgi:RNA recognition motif-containing protein